MLWTEGDQGYYILRAELKVCNISGHPRSAAKLGSRVCNNTAGCAVMLRSFCRCAVTSRRLNKDLTAKGLTYTHCTVQKPVIAIVFPSPTSTKTNIKYLPPPSLFYVYWTSLSNGGSMVHICQELVRINSKQSFHSKQMTCKEPSGNWSCSSVTDNDEVLGCTPIDQYLW
jgi:hypothetical protein